MSDEQPPRPESSSDALLAEFAEELSVLVRRDLELVAAERGPQLRRFGVELAAGIAVAVALLLACIAASAAAAEGLAHAIPAWCGWLVVAAAWAGGAGLLLLLDHPRRLVRRLVDETAGSAVERATQERLRATATLRATAEHLARAVGREAAMRELHAPIDDAERLLEGAEHEGDDLVKEVLVALLAPGRAGLSVLELLLGGRRPRQARPPRDGGVQPPVARKRG